MRPLTIVLIAFAASCGGPSRQNRAILSNPNPEELPGILSTDGPVGEFKRNGFVAHEKYLGKVVTVRGIVISVVPEFGMIRVQLGERERGASHTSAMFDATPRAKQWAKTIGAGDSIRVRGLVMELSEYSMQLLKCAPAP